MSMAEERKLIQNAFFLDDEVKSGPPRLVKAQTLTAKALARAQEGSSRRNSSLKQTENPKSKRRMNSA